ncbi:LuxR C-terminal-related transcriptional regulator [Sinimarinibacterium sp. NLF-5-8]|uniref:helix-turn-helix domain-containing protein n=1 Tax=Sinimarinibacterium sp. NLF-5-8 TaxID=2698684 RepID=UPI001EE4B46B|nr:LuxR C-terminal-related transcriptional regulator [Sinimarinibacterium sp. NLF-5-8]
METNHGSSSTFAVYAVEDALTHGELRVLQLLANGATNREIAGQAQISENTVKFHLKNVYGKLGVGTRKAAASLALRRGLIAAI